jgi:hypothetical protein
MLVYLDKAHAMAKLIRTEEDRLALLNDLATIQ